MLRTGCTSLIRFCAALIQHKYGTDLLHGSVTDVLSYVLYTDCIYVSVRRCKIQVLYRHFIHICGRFVIISIVYKLYSQVCRVMQNTDMVGSSQLDLNLKNIPRVHVGQV